MRGRELYSSESGQGPAAGFCESCNERLGSATNFLT
jgi:hypothetical protein